MANKIINFHDVYDKDWFEKTILILKKKYQIIGVEKVDEYLYSKIKLRNSCLITIDDGDRTFYDVIFPILLKHKLPAILFVSPKIIMNNQNFWFQEIRDFEKTNLNKIICNYFNNDLSEYSNGSILKNCKIEDIWKIIKIYKEQYNFQSKKQYNMNINQLKEVHESKIVKIGAHTENHPILGNENDETSKKEISESIQNLKAILNCEIHYFAYPNGTPNLDYNKREVLFLKENGIRLAFSTESRNLSINSSPFEIPRFGISYGSAAFVKTKLQLGRYWEIIKNIKSVSEENLRRKIQTKISLD
jgi:poly-beta-1,6-N-acetyl-D-glucosamine N-deacetylase